MAYYTIPTVNDTKDMYTIMNYVNVVTGNIFWPIMLFVIFIIWTLGSTFIGKPIHRSFLYSAFICSILGILLSIMGWLSTNYLYFCFLLTGLGVLWVRLAEAYS